MTIQERINKILERYLDSDNAGGILSGRFREWFGNEGHIDEKYEALERSFEKEVGFDAAPSPKVFDSFEKLSAQLGFPEAKSTGRSASLSWRRMLVRVAAVLVPVFIVAGTMMYMTRTQDSPGMDIRAFADIVEEIPLDEQKHIVLPDGSHVWANSGTEIGFNEDFLANRIVFVNGETYFDVKNIDDQPFRVRCCNLTITVKGTEFNIKAYKDSLVTDVILASGKVDVLVGDEIFEMTPNMGISLDNRSMKVTMREVTGDEIPRWMTRLHFDNISYEEAFRIISEYFRVSIEVNTEFSGHERVTAMFDEDVTLDKVLRVLQNTRLGFSYEIAGDVVRVTKY